MPRCGERRKKKATERSLERGDLMPQLQGQLEQSSYTPSICSVQPRHRSFRLQRGVIQSLCGHSEDGSSNILCGSRHTWYSILQYGLSLQCSIYSQLHIDADRPPSPILSTCHVSVISVDTERDHPERELGAEADCVSVEHICAQPGISLVLDGRCTSGGTHWQMEIPRTCVRAPWWTRASK